MLEDDHRPLTLGLDRVVDGRAHLALDAADLLQVDRLAAQVVVGPADRELTHLGGVRLQGERGDDGAVPVGEVHAGEVCLRRRGRSAGDRRQRLPGPAGHDLVGAEHGGVRGDGGEREAVGRLDGGSDLDAVDEHGRGRAAHVQGGVELDGHLVQATRLLDAPVVSGEDEGVLGLGDRGHRCCQDRDGQPSHPRSGAGAP